jgi:DNA-binding transcriptional MerR regulator
MMNLNKDLLKIGELAKAAGVPVSTIHYYVQEGLLTPPTRTSRNMAYYDPHSIQEISVIQELQAKKYLPLSAIKLILQAERDGQDKDHVIEMQSFLEGLFEKSGDGNILPKISSQELMTASGLSESRLKDLEEGGFIRPQKTEQGITYDNMDIRIARTIKALEGWGLKQEELDFYRQYIELVQVEARKMHEAIHRLPNHDAIPITDIFQAINDLKACLALKIYRQEVQGSHSRSLNVEKNP